MKQEAIAAAFAEQGTWVTRFSIDGVNYGGSYDAMNDSRLDDFAGAFPNVATVLELGSLEGGHAIAQARRPGISKVLGLEGREGNLARARLAARLLEANKVEFALADLEKVSLREFGCFDVVFCSGLLYHLPEPWKLLRQFSAASSRAFLWTHYCQEKEADTFLEGYKGRMQIEGGLDEPLSGLSQYSFWPTLGSLVQMLTDAGFDVLHLLENDFAHAEGPAVTIAAFVTN